MVIFLFWTGAMALTLLALALLLPALLRGRREQDAASARRRQLERELAALKVRHDQDDLDPADYTSQRERLSTQLILAIEEGSTPSPAAPPQARGLALALALLVPALALVTYFSIGRPDALDYRSPAMSGSDAGAMPIARSNTGVRSFIASKSLPRSASMMRPCSASGKTIAHR